jgi:hypothetical protein
MSRFVAAMMGDGKLAEEIVEDRSRNFLSRHRQGLELPE